MDKPVFTAIQNGNQLDLINELRTKIRHCGKNFRNKNDNSESIFNPEQGTVTAYDIGLVESLLDQFQKASVQRLSIRLHGSEEEVLYQMAQDIEETPQEAKVLNFAERVEQYMLDHAKDVHVH